MSEEPAHFTAVDGGFMPTRFAQSHWGDDHLNGPAIVGLAARGLENDCGSTEFRPTRLTVDLFRAARNVLTTLDIRALQAAAQRGGVDDDGRRERHSSRLATHTH